MRACLDDPAAIEHDNAVGALRGVYANLAALQFQTHAPVAA
jgi:hypothetical protein